MARNDRFKTQSQRIRSSKGELDLFRILKKMFPIANFYTERSYSFFCNTLNNHLKADVYCQTFNVVFEMNGQHHYAPVYYKKDEESVFESNRNFEEIKKRDALKVELCKEANINLIVIPHFEWEALKSDEEKQSYLLDRL